MPQPSPCASRGALPRAGEGVLILLFALSLSAQTFQQNSDRLIASALSGSGAWDVLSYLGDNIGPRLSGSPGAARAVRWTTERFRSWGIDVHNEKVMVPHWVRGIERASLVSHNNQQIILTALGGSVATPPEGITADVIEVTSYDQLKALGKAKTRGKIVFMHRALDPSMVEAGHAFEAYSKAVEFRTKGADWGAEFGAAAVIIRSVTSASLRTPHTGSVKYEGKQPKIPAAAMAVEDAMIVHRLLAKGERVRMHLVLTPKMLPDVESANVVAQIRGSQRPNEIVVIGGHLDSWDLGSGAIDNATGVAMVMETMRLIKSLGIQPRRTIRCVLFMNEENGLRGGKGYAAAHASEMANHVAVVESDSGAATPLGFNTTLQPDALGAFGARATPMLQRIGSMSFQTAEDTGADSSPLTEQGVPGFGFSPDARHYFDYHHSPADTVDKVNPDDLAKDTAAVAALAYLLADQETNLPRVKVVRPTR